MEIKKTNEKEIIVAVKAKIQHEINETVSTINALMNEEFTEENTNKIANFFIILSNLNQAIMLLNMIQEKNN